VNLKVFGGFALLVGDRAVPTLPRKARALLAYLAVHPDRSMSREGVAELIWSDRGPEQARHSLRQTLTVIRKHFFGEQIVRVRDGALSLSDAVVCDAAPVARLSRNSNEAEIRSAVDTYSGPLLDGFPPVSRDFDEWLMVSRAKFETQVLDHLARLGDKASAAADTATALELAERMFAIDPLREDIHRRLLETCVGAGRRSEALRHYGNIVAALRTTLGVAPAAETRALVRRIQGDDGAESLAAESSARVEAPSLPARVRAADNVPPVAVLPYRLQGDPPPISHLADGLVTDIVCQLAGLREMRVISQGTTLSLKNDALDARAAGQMLGVRYVVTGTIRRSGAVMRLTTELADTETGLVAWCGSHDTQAALSFADQDQIVARIVNTLTPQVHEIELRRIRGKRPESLTVYEKVVLAREYLLTMHRDDLLAAKRLLDEAVSIEPDYAEPYALLADYHGLMAAEGLSSDRAADIAAVEQTTRRALSLDSNNLRALIFYAHRKSLLRREYDGARDMFKHALEVSPHSAPAWLWSSYVHSWTEDTDEALRRAYQALALSPMDRRAPDFHSAICTAHYTAGQYREAVEWGLRAIDEPGVMRGTWRWTAASLAALGETEHAREVMREGMQRLPGQRAGELMRSHPYRDPGRRRRYCEHLVAAGMPA